MARKWIAASRIEGVASRQAHADLPAGTYEREMSKEGFFGPAAFFHHRRPPTSWSRFEGPLRPRAFDLARLGRASASPWSAPAVLANGACEIRFWTLDRDMPALARNADGDQILFVHEGSAALFCDFGHLAVEAGDYIVLPRGTMWRLAPEAGMRILMIEATNAHFTLPDKGLMGGHAIFDPALLDAPRSLVLPLLFVVATISALSALIFLRLPKTAGASLSAPARRIGTRPGRGSAACRAPSRCARARGAARRRPG